MSVINGDLMWELHRRFGSVITTSSTRFEPEPLLFTTLAPCILCTGAILLFGIPRVVVGEARTFDGDGSLDLLRSRGVEVEMLDDEETRLLLASWVEGHLGLWNEDIGH